MTEPRGFCSAKSRIAYLGFFWLFCGKTTKLQYNVAWKKLANPLPLFTASHLGRRGGKVYEKGRKKKKPSSMTGKKTVAERRRPQAFSFPSFPPLRLSASIFLTEIFQRSAKGKSFLLYRTPPQVLLNCSRDNTYRTKDQKKIRRAFLKFSRQLQNQE